MTPHTSLRTVMFKSAGATSTSGHTGTISDSAWTATKIQLESELLAAEVPADRTAPTPPTPRAAPPPRRALSPAGGSAFAVTWNTGPEL